MTKYVVIEMQNGYVENRAWPYESREDAETKMFQVLAEVVKSPIEVHTVMLMTDEGHVLETRCYRHETEQA
jgi:hypothetical protein